MSTQPKTYLTPEQYLEIERKAEYKSEYYDGEMLAMSGASLRHGLLVNNTSRELSEQLRARRCFVVTGDMRVRVSETGLYTYPDVVVIRDEPQLLDNELDTLLNPTVLIEVLSPSTESYDRGPKFEHYRTIESLREYLLLAPDRVHAELYTRESRDKWVLTVASRAEDAIELKSIDCWLSVAALYEKVDLVPIRTPDRRPPPPKSK